MPDPVKLPPELFDAILDCIDERSFLALDHLRNGRHSSVEGCLKSCVLVNRDWHARSTPRLYSDFACENDPSMYRRLLLFLLAVIRNKVLREHVKVLRLPSHSNFLRQSAERISQGDFPQKEAAKKAILYTGRQLGFSNAQLVQVLKREEIYPLVLILISCLPNITDIGLRLREGDPINNPRIPAVMDKLTTLGKLRTLSLSFIYTKSPETLDLSTLSLDEPGSPMLSLRKLILLNVKTLVYPTYTAMLNIASESLITHLTIAAQCWITGFSSRAEAVNCALDLPTRLVSLTLHLSCNQCDEYDEPLLFHEEQFADGLVRSSQTLQYLDLYDDHAYLCFSQGRQQRLLWALHKLKRLKTLRIQADLLLGCSTWTRSLIEESLTSLPKSLQYTSLYSSRSVTEGLEGCVLGSAAVHYLPNLEFLTLHDAISSEEIWDFKDSPLIDVCVEAAINLTIYTIDGQNGVTRGWPLRSRIYDSEKHPHEAWDRVFPEYPKTFLRIGPKNNNSREDATESEHRIHAGYIQHR